MQRTEADTKKLETPQCFSIACPPELVGIRLTKALSISKITVSYAKSLPFRRI